MATINSYILVSDMFDVLNKISYNEEKTVESLLFGTINDLKGNKGTIHNLKALNYFILFRNNCKNVSIVSCQYEKVIRECFNQLVTMSYKDDIVSSLLGSVIENCFFLIEENKLKKIFGELIGFINEKIFIDNADKCDILSSSLLILEKICNFISSENTNGIIFPSSLITAIVNLITELNLEASRKTFVSVLPKFILSQDSNTVLQQVWAHLLKLNSIENNGKQLFYLCLLADHFISVNHSKIYFPLYEEVELWQIIQKGLYNEDSINRKQSLYLLKRYIDELNNSNISINLDIFYWDIAHKDQLNEFWKKIFILIEVIEEKQTHLVTPALKIFPTLVSLCHINEKMCYSWIYCVFLRLLNHPSSLIVKWSIKEFCNTKIKHLFNDTKLREILNCFFDSLNNIFLFNVENTFPSDLSYEEYLKNWFTSIVNEDSSEQLFEYVLEQLCNTSWSSIPLFFVINSISSLPPKPLINSNSLGTFNKILLITLKNQNIFIRSAIQCRLLKSLHQLMRNDIDIIALTNTLGLFNQTESLKRGTGIWKICVELLEKIPYDINNFFTIFTQNLMKKQLVEIDCQEFKAINSTKSIARMLILVMDSNKLYRENDIDKHLKIIFEQFHNCEKRSYLCIEVLDNCLEFLQCLLAECSTLSHFGSDDHKLIELIKPHIPDMLTYIYVRLVKGPIENFQNSLLYEKTFSEILNNNYLANFATVKTLEIFKSAIQILSVQSASFHVYFSIKIINNYLIYMLKSNTPNIILPFEEKIVNILKKFLFSNHKLDYINSSVDPMSSLKGKLISETKHSLWSIFHLYLEFKRDVNSVLMTFPISILFGFALDGVSEDGKQTLIPILKSFTQLLPYHKNVSEINRFISICWNACFELRKSELFWHSIKEWIKMVYQDGVVENNDSHHLIIDYAKTILYLGEELIGLVDIFVDQFNKLNFIPKFSNVISEILIFGTILKKDKRMELEVCEFIKKSVETHSIESFGSGSSLKTDREVRLKVLNSLLNMKEVKCRNELIVNVVNELLLCDNELTKNNKRYFNNSVIHRKKHKMLQALLIIEKYIFNNPSQQFNDLPEIIYNWVLQSLTNYSQQPSVRYQLEWLFVRLNIHYPELLKKFWDHFTKAGCERLGSMCSFISIAYHLAVALNNSHFLEESIDNILPWCMSQNFNIRLYAQVLLSKLLNLSTEISKKYECITKNQWKIYEQEGNMLANAKKMENDFYFTIFHPVHHFSLKTLYWDLPRLSNISSDEWINPDKLKKYSDLCNQNINQSQIESLESCESPKWVLKSSGLSDDKIDGSNIQKKFIPWKGMFQETENKTKLKKSDLIIVASLIDKAANLGGLARTCEVFAAKELVVSNLDVMKEKEFMSLSMTAEKHINFSEVKTYNLEEYLKSMKDMGYLLIGAEQTTQSVSLANYQFPQQCIVLLGNEKEGIPPNLLPLLEVYIEIPQLGLVRSLNVHVTGAIFIWEYTRQHSLKQVQ